MDVSQYLDIFIEESSEHIQSLSDNIMVLENEPENKDTINEIFRAAHSLKGMAGTMGFKRMQHLTHDMENLFSEVRNDNIKVNSELIDILFNCLDAIEAYVDTVKSTSDEGTEDNEVLTKKLNDFLESSEGGDVSDSAGNCPHCGYKIDKKALDTFVPKTTPLISSKPTSREIAISIIMIFFGIPVCIWGLLSLAVGYGYLILLIGIIVLGVGISYLRLYQDGICPYCGGKLRLSRGNGVNHGRYAVKCGHCQNVILKTKTQLITTHSADNETK